MAEYTTADMVKFALEKQPTNFNAAFNDIMADKVLQAIDLKKQEVAKKYFDNGEAEENSEQDTDTDTNQSEE